MLALRELVPNWTVEDQSGAAHRVWDYRQKAHLALIYDPTASSQTRERWQAAIQTDKKQWEWLQTTLLVVRKAPEEMSPGVYLIDRYGHLLSYFSLDHWNFDILEKELIYYEARHC